MQSKWRTCHGSVPHHSPLLPLPFADVSLVKLPLLLRYKSPMTAAGTRSWILDQAPSPAPVTQRFLCARAPLLCPHALFLQECRHLHGEFHGPACGHDGPYTPNVLFWSCILFFSTFVLSSSLKMFKTSRYFPTRVGRRQGPAAGPALIAPNTGAFATTGSRTADGRGHDLEGHDLH